MSLDQDFMQQLRLAFAVEAQEHLQSLSRNLLALEQQPATEAREPLLAEIFRAAHSLKGAARAVGLEGVAVISHHLEDIFGQIRSGALQPHPGQYDLLYRALDALAELVAGTDGDGALTPAAAELVTQLASFGALAVAAVAPVMAQATAPDVAPPVHAPVPEPLPTVSTPVAAAVAAPARAPGTNALDETVRVTTAKLDAIMEQVGELQVARLNALQQQRRLRGLLEEVERWRADLRKRHTVHWSANCAPRAALSGQRQACLLYTSPSPRD